MQVLKTLLNIACNMQNMQNNMHDMQNMQMLFPICRICTARFADGTERYRAVQKGTGQYTKWYKAVQVKVQQGTRQYMAVHVSTRSAFAPGRGRGGRGGGRFWCSFEIAALTAPTVASASSH